MLFRSHFVAVFVGTASPELGVANTATKWAGVEWTMVMWPVPQYKQPRMRLMLHECFHRVQGQLGLQATDAQNGHLDSLGGRIWLQIEWRALEHAFWQQGEERKRDVADAVYFRSYRRSLFPVAAKNENALEKFAADRGCLEPHGRLRKVDFRRGEHL